MVDKTVQKIFGEKVRVRACGLCWDDGKILLVNHFGLYQHDFWAPPGGGVDFGVSVDSTVKKEFREETGLAVRVGNFQFACEFIKSLLHAIELYFEVEPEGGRLITGTDPELGHGEQIIKAAKYFTIAELQKLPARNKHALFKGAKSMEKIRTLKGYLKI